MLNILSFNAIFTPEASMKDQTLKKGIEMEGSDTEDGIMIDRIEDEIDPYGELSLFQLMKMMNKSRKFFRISAELSINSN